MKLHFHADTLDFYDSPESTKSWTYHFVLTGYGWRFYYRDRIHHQSRRVLDKETAYRLFEALKNREDVEVCSHE